MKEKCCKNCYKPYNHFTVLDTFTAKKTIKIRPLSRTKMNGKIVSPSAVLKQLAENHFVVVDDEASRGHMLNAKKRLGFHVTTRKCKSGYEIHKLPTTPALESYG